MSYQSIETSNYDGRPVFLYEFSINGNYWRHTSADIDIGANGFIWSHEEISDDGIRQTGETSADVMKLSMSINVPVISMFFGTPPASPLTVAIYKKHEGAADVQLAYVGDVTQVDFPVPGQAELSLTTLASSMERVGLRLSWMRSCPYALYDKGCKVDKNLHKHAIVIQSVGGGIITSKTDLSIFGDGYFSGGFVEWSRTGRGIDRRGIEDHKGNKLLLMGASDGFTEGSTINLYPGCLRDTETCETKFNNLLNYGGAPHMPGKSPFSGDPIF